MSNHLRIGILGRPDGTYVRRLIETAVERGHMASAVDFADIQTDITESGSTTCCGRYSSDELDLVLIRTMSGGTLEQVITRMNQLMFLESRGVMLINSPRAVEAAVDKGLATWRLQQAGLRTPRTILCESTDLAMEAFRRLGRDVLLKPLFGSEGRGILRITDEITADRCFRALAKIGTVFYLQKFISSIRDDLRILLFDGCVLGAVKRELPAGEYRSNTAFGSTNRPWNPSDDEVESACRAAAAVSCRFAGVDLLRDADGSLYVIEVNAVPGWLSLQRALGINVTDLFYRKLEDSIRS